MEGDFEEVVVATVDSIFSSDAAAREHTQRFLEGTSSGNVDTRQRFLDTLVELAGGGVVNKSFAALLLLRKVDMTGLKLDELFDAMLTKELSTLHGARLLAWAREKTRTAIPEEVVQRARESTRPLALGLWLASDATDVGVALEKAMSGPVKLQEQLGACVGLAGRKCPDVAERLFRRNLSQGRASLDHDVRVLSEAGVTFHPASFSDSEWDRLCSADSDDVEDLWSCFVARPDRLVENFLRRALAADSGPLSGPSAVWNWLHPVEADMLVKRCDEDPTMEDESVLAWIAAQPQASMQVRERLLLKRLPSELFWIYLDSDHGYGRADWKCFSSCQLEAFGELQPGIAVLLSFAREVVWRKMVLKPPLRRVLLDPTTVASVGSDALFWYALHDLSLFDGKEAKPSNGEEEDKARDIVFRLVGRWSAKRHRHLPRSVQQVALATMWALKPRVGTRHVVYIILERALVAQPIERDNVLTLQQFEAVLALLRL
jgi:hypothetical protein